VHEIPECDSSNSGDYNRDNEKSDKTAHPSTTAPDRLCAT